MVIGSCQSLTPQRHVDEENTFYSSLYPKVSISIDHELDYIGSIKHSKYFSYKNTPGGSTIYFEKFFFGLKDSHDHLRRGVIIRTRKLHEGYILPDLFDFVSYRLDNGVISFGSQNYQYAVFPTRKPYLDLEENYLLDQGFILSDKFVVKGFSRREGSGNNYSIDIYYLESLNEFNRGRTRFRDWKRKEYLSEEQKHFIKLVEENCDRCIHVIPVEKSP
jgi:hypothetical protein